MKFTARIAAIALLCAGSAYANPVFRTFFNVRPFQPQVTQMNLMIDQATDSGRVLRKPALEVSVFGGGSTSSKELAQYFMFNTQTTLSVTGTLAANEAAELNYNILSTNFNVDDGGAGFQSNISFSPTHSFYGFGISGRKHFYDRFWAMFELPIIHVSNNMRITETIINSSGDTGTTGIGGNPAVANMTAAFQQPGLLYGKINGAQSKTGIADFTLKVGYDNPYLNRKDLFMNVYLGVVFPTGNKAKAVYMFEPICGNGGHYAIMFGSHGDVDLGKFRSGRFWLSWDAQTQYVFENTQMRSFDLVLNGPWSRYLSMYPTTAAQQAATGTNQPDVPNAQYATFGINLLTQPAKVKPGYCGTFDTAFSYVDKNFYATGGYTTYIRHPEKVELANPWPYIEATITAANFSGSAAVPVGGDTNRFRTIGTTYANENTTGGSYAVPLQQSDIDLNSASHPGDVSWAVHGCLGYQDQDIKYPFVAEAGGSYEWTRHNGGMGRWGLWGKLRLNF